MARPPSDLREADPLALAAEYLELNRRWREEATPLSVSELQRWRDLRGFLERLLDAATPSGKQPRSSLRVPIRLPVEFSDRTGRATGLLIQIAEGGIFIATQCPLEPAAKVRVAIVWESDSDGIEVEGTVMWSRPREDSVGLRGMGVRFDNPDAMQCAKILDLVRHALLLTLSRQDPDRE